MEAHEAKLNITYNGVNADLPDAVQFDTTEANIRRVVREALETGYVPGIPAQLDPDIDDFVVERFQANDARPNALIMVRPKTPFGA